MKNSVIRKRQKGLTLIEMLTATSILMTVSLGMATFIPASFKNNDRNKRQIVSTQIINQVMEEINRQEFNTINAGTEPERAQNEPLITVLDTRGNDVSIDTTVSPPLVTGNTISMGDSSNPLTYPRLISMNNVNYRVDLLVQKGPFDQIASLSPAQSDNKLSDFLVPPALAGNNASLSIQMTPSTAIGYKNTTPFQFSSSCSGCPPERFRQYNWNFGVGEGNNSGDAAPVKTFSVPGSNKEVFLTITDTRDPSWAVSTRRYLTIKESAVTVEVIPNAPETGETVTFRATCSTDNNMDCGSSPQFVWTFGDGQSQTGQTVTHVYQESGNYTPAVTVTGGADPTASQPISVSPAGGRQAIINLNPGSTGIAGPLDNSETTNFQFETTSRHLADTGASAVVYKLNFGDGSPEVELRDENPNDSSFPSSNHRYLLGGDYKVSMTATPVGGTDTSPVITSTTVHAQSKVEILTSTTTVNVGQQIRFDTTALGTGQNPAYNWSFGDGQNQVNYAGMSYHTFAEPGLYDVSVQVEGGTRPSAVKQIQVVTINGTGHDQAEMKKITVFISPWTGKGNQQKINTSSVFFLGQAKR
ncbi:hypothetical protein COW36_11210 [bacterium (Candidatus Blackallbacteria) CG17_big_fil_post_rev_8_21_14_2_50_48_46]|uniref:PKD domain-containing protein n=1 Tax=bacterium (Candidatus Blackallbacteria) CG17_big_fil_post_rev_8_21_14_2_50_48_46 TaxID=2014261 RepID=A0A2M7G4L9_9BACT|nr:MAG: hypothetical protein COW64_18305 [bacterium (Candidatus Blackallbacteria) CG18_big_fil_WC_8_21_14_2_50_49_26]PIW16843.1 MAG: hypothetical protein COW36_11210 [bacterium (Candidatus Blackallbacteria) CG17_big_fil_post_rev_8_21_14_2_50_48_46]PIW48040.1 MAG: hypothetical protein COW20_10925 [bacterium (Candidatus Blackallbacteria) CG13_big_fil_rev_8_21_14_2_50_49_14]